ncbi:hypothetical protein LEP3755_33270 [Leptolyngbya sp. NIES-3755]|nr:hypothetical protein LEP3755_33270 [Leptolyngbya sp. NIES-3755]
MSSPTSVIRRYTPPTCTLEIAAKDSPLSRWMGQSVLKNLRFKLSFDDPRVSEDQWITVRGDRNQLQALTDAVSHYVQNFLSQSSRFSTQSSIGVAEPVTDFLTQAEQNSAGIHLKPKGLISHELHLGSLANDSSGSVLSLSAVQLADLATALDECSADVTTLPNLEKPRWQTVTPAWGTIAAAAIVAVGVTASIARVFEPTAPTQTATSQGASSNDQRLPVQPLPNTTPAPNTIATLPTAPPPLATLPSTTTPPAPSISTTPTQPDTPRLKVAQEAPVSPPPQLEIPIRDVPVPAIPDQTRTSQAPSVAKASPNPNADPAPPASQTEVARSVSPAAASLQANAPRPVPAGTTIPQVAEVRAYFQKNWKPPQGMTEDIEYRLTLKPDGTIDRIEPLGQEAIRLLDASFPVTGQEFVTPIKGNGTPVIRLRLTPKGVVQTFLEAQ